MERTISNKQSLNEVLKNACEGDVFILEDGNYCEKVEINTNRITLKAKNPHKVIISNKDYYHKIMPNHNECNTFGTYTLYIGGNDVQLKDIVIRNDATPSEVYGQAVALHVNGTRFKCDNCIIESAQDTLFTGPMPKDLIERYQGFYSQEKLLGLPSSQIYHQCKIIGDVDFIFGGATVLFDECAIVTVERKSGFTSYIAAPSHEKTTEFGYLFYRCSLISSVQMAETFLARPWRDYGCAAFIECSLGQHIHPLGFNKWNNTDRDKTARFFEYSENIDCSQREKWSIQLTKAEAQKYYQDFMNYLNM